MPTSMGPNSTTLLDQTLEKEYQRGEKIREAGGKNEHPHLRESIDKRWKAVRHFYEIPEADQKSIIRSIVDQIHIHRALFEEILGTNSAADTSEKLISGEISPAAITVMVNQYLEQYLEKKSEEEKIRTETIVAFLTRNLAEHLRMTVEKDKTQRIIDADRAGMEVDVKDFGVNKISINGIIENSTDYVENTLKRILFFLKKYVFGEKANNISFALANEKNNYGEEKYFTHMSAENGTYQSDEGQSLLPSELNPNEPYYDQQTRSVYLKIVNQDRLIGTLRVTLKNKYELDEYDMEMLKQIASRIDTYSDLKVAKLRLEKAIEQGEETLEKNKRQVDFDNGIKELAMIACRNSRARKALVIYKKPGLEGKTVAKIYHKDGSVEQWPIEPHLAQILCENEAKTISHEYMQAGKIVDQDAKIGNTIYRDLLDISKPHHPPIGKIMLQNNDEDRVMSDDDKEMLDQMGGLTDTHIARRKMTLALLSKTMDPRVAEALSNGELLENSREKMTMFFVDIAAWTDKCQKLSQLKHGDKIFRLAELFLGRVQKIGQKYGGVWCNDVGDCGILLFGPPYYKNGKDGLGLTKENPNREAYHAMNALKAYIAIQAEITDMNNEYSKILNVVAEEFYKGRQTSMDQLATKPLKEEDRKKYLLEKLGREYQLKPTIGVTTGFYSGEVNVGILNLPSSQRYTVLDDAMNMTARYQTAALEGEALIPLTTKNYIERLKEENIAVPYNDKDDAQTWQEFLEDDLHIRLAQEPEPVLQTIQEYYEMKSTRGVNLGYRIRLQRQSSDSKREKMKTDRVLTEQELLGLEGEYLIVATNRHDVKNTFILTLRTLTQPYMEFKAEVAQGKITKSEKTRVVSEEEALRRGNCDEDHILVVHNYHLQTYQFESMEKKLRAKVDELGERLVNDDEIPVGVYGVMFTVPDKNSSDYMVYNLRHHSGKTFRARIPMDRVKDTKECELIKKDHDLFTRYSAHYFALKNGETSKHGSQPAQELIYIQGSEYYTIPLCGLEKTT